MTIIVIVKMGQSVQAAENIRLAPLLSWHVRITRCYIKILSLPNRQDKIKYTRHRIVL